MRLWTIHPSQLDRAALIAGWREGLLAQKVLAGLTKGYKNHPQLDRFKAQPEPMKAIGAWLSGLQEEATARGYSFDATKITFPAIPENPINIPVTDGQIAYEAAWLRSKIAVRAPHLLTSEPWISGEFRAHPIFVVVPGPIEPWEKIA